VTDIWPVPPAARSFDIAGAAVPYIAEGSGEPVVLAHGAMGDLRSLLPVARRLADAYQAVTLSLPALTAADRPLRPFGTGGQVADLLDFIARLGRGPVHLVAWSYAAHAALVIAARHPAMVKSLFVFEPGFPTYLDDGHAADAVMEDMMQAYEPVGAAFAACDAEEAVRQAIDAAAMEPGYFDRQPQAYRTIHLDNAGSLPALFEQTPPTVLTAAELAAIACHATIARGARTRLCYSLVTDAAARLVPGARHIVVDGAGHLLPEQDPQGFAALVREHVGRAGSAKGAA
jgi:pimeloyl-ACP methyl ester carboxylesterase